MMPPFTTHSPNRSRLWTLPLLWCALSGCEAKVRAASLRPVSTSQPKVVVEDTRQGLKNWPCQRCHDKITLDPQASPISNQHMEINIQHFAGAERCITCHDHQRVERLRLLTQETVPMTQSSLACGQCHAEKKRDWDIGAHGKHVGSWSGTRYRATCPDCHNPHAPRRSSVVALPAPPRPKLGIPKDHSHD